MERNDALNKEELTCELPKKSLREQAKEKVTQPPVSTIFSKIICTVLLFGSLWGLLGDSVLPGGHIFALFVLTIASYIGGQLIEMAKLPSLLGMLIVGFALQNIPGIDVAKDLDPHLSSILRTMALGIILLRAGMGLDPVVLKRLSIVCIRLAFTPCVIECAVVGVASYFLLEMPWLWSFMLGFIISAVSPAVIVPAMLILQEKGLGVDKGIPTLSSAVAGIDDVLAVIGFGVVFSVTFAQGELAWTIAKGPVEIVIGLVYGLILGAICWFLPNKEEEYVIPLRVFLIIFGGFFGMFVGEACEMKSAGPLGCLTLSFIAALNWRKEGNSSVRVSVSRILNGVWQVFQPILFSLIGSEIRLSTLEGHTVGLGLATIGIGLVFRMITSSLVAFGSGFSTKEKIFFAVAWLPKATVQAAIGPVALDYARKTNSGHEVEALGTKVLTIAALSILATAPLGAAIISFTAPKLLKTKPKSFQNDLTTDNVITHL